MQVTVPRHRVFGEVGMILCEGSNMGTKFRLGECKEGGVRLLRKGQARKTAKGLMRASTPLGGGGSQKQNISEIWITRCLSKHCV